MGWLVRFILFSLLITLAVRAVMRLVGRHRRGRDRWGPARGRAAGHEDGEGPGVRHLCRAQQGADGLAGQPDRLVLLARMPADVAASSVTIAMTRRREGAKGSTWVQSSMRQHG